MTVTVTDAWTQVTAGGDYIVQVRGRIPMEIAVQGAAPTAGEQALLLNPGQGLNSSMMAGTVYARSASSTESAILAVVE